MAARVYQMTDRVRGIYGLEICMVLGADDSVNSEKAGHRRILSKNPLVSESLRGVFLFVAWPRD